ncbi:MAG: Gfo/Idh/MocA family oxidoreductase [Pseudonocardiaceae bacterium]
MFQSLIVGLGRSGRGLHLPVLSRARAMPAAKHLFDDRPILAFNPWDTQAELPGGILVRSLAQAGDMTDPERTIVHLCSPPDTRVEVLEQLAQLGFRKVVVEKPLAVDEQDLTEIVELRQRWNLDLVVVAPWLASGLTHRIREILRSGELGALRSVFVVQRKPRFTRSLAGCGHPTAFDIEMPHSVGVALAIAGNANVCNARLTDMKFEDVVIPRLGSAWLSLDHESGVCTEIHSDLTSPTRERRITLKLEHGTMIGHYSNSEADHTAQLSTTVSEHETRRVFHDDALTSFILRAYARFAAAGRGSADLTVNIEVVRLLSDAKRICLASSQVGAGLPPRRYDGNGLAERAY